MYLARNNSELGTFMKALRSSNDSVGFVPTMGALHEGHMALIERCAKENDVCIASVFVNPAQFNDKNDLNNYPRQTDKDFEILQKAGCQLMFAPQVSDIYPDGVKIIDVNLDGIENTIEGKYRPGHFRGVATVIDRFFELIRPSRAYFGLKDYQQVVVVQKLVARMPYNIEIVPCETVRDQNGLALSSRNKLLNTQEKQEAAVIYQTLQFVKEQLNQLSIDELMKAAQKKFDDSPLTLEYLKIIDGDSFQEVKNVADHKKIVASIAAFHNNVRLIDNLILKS